MQDMIHKVTSNLTYHKNEVELKYKVAENKHTQLPMASTYTYYTSWCQNCYLFTICWSFLAPCITH